MARSDKSNPALVVQTAVIGGVLLGVLLLGVQWLTDNVLADGFPALYPKLRIGLSLLAIWLVVGAIVRSIHRTRPTVPFHWLLLGGVLTAPLGTLVYQLGLLITKPGLAAFDLSLLLAAAAVGGLAALLSSINLKVRNRLLGNVIEGAVIVLLAVLFYASL